MSEWALRLWVGRRKEPILGYVPKRVKKKNSDSKGLSVEQSIYRKFDETVGVFFF